MMKRLIATGGFLIASFAIFPPASSRACTGGVNGFSVPSEHYEWRRVIEPGRGCFQDNCAQGRWAMAIVPLTAFENKLFIVGVKSVWSSADGVNWNSQPKTDWGERNGMAYLFFDNKLWMLGGMRSWADFRNDVWYSSDGKDWKLATANTAWTPRRDHSVLVFDNKMWLLGGVESSGRADQLPSRLLNDVWSSADGVKWTKVTANAPARGGHIALVFRNKLWLIDGVGRDVWSSSNGRDWTQATATAGWGARQNNGGLVFDGRMWVFGGRGLNDVWYSLDGEHWQMAFAHAPWSTRTASYSVVFDDKLWIFGGKTGREDSWTESSDVWTMFAADVKTPERLE